MRKLKVINKPDKPIKERTWFSDRSIKIAFISGAISTFFSILNFLMNM